MKRFLECIDGYMHARDWKLLAGLKFSLCAIGVLHGLVASGKGKKAVSAGTVGVLLATCIPVMADFLAYAEDYFREDTM